MRQVVSELEHLRQTSRRMLIIRRAAALLAWMLAAAIALIGLDYLLRMPAAVRLILLLAGAGALGYGLRRWLAPALSFRPTLTQLALRVEQMLPGVSGRLASSIEFVAAGVDEHNGLAARSVRDTEGRLAGDSVMRVVNAGPTWRDLSIAAVLAAAAVVGSMLSPASASIGLNRLLLPYGSAQWPARTGVESLMDQVVHVAGVHPRGTALPLRARATKQPLDQRVDAHFRLKVEGGWQPWQQIVLTHQGEGVHERLVDTNAESIELYFSTSDAESNAQEIALIPPPAVERATLTVTPPSYAAERVAPLEAELGPGVDARAVTERPSLIGSSVTLTLQLNKLMPVPVTDDDAATISDEGEQWLSRTLGWTDGPLPSFTASQTGEGENDASAPSLWTLRWPLQGTRTLDLNLVDEYGVSNGEPISYRIEAVEDRVPTVTMTQPQADEAVLPTAVVNLEADGRDDVALASLGLEATLQRSGQEAAPAAAAPTDSRAVTPEQADVELVPGTEPRTQPDSARTKKPAWSINEAQAEPAGVVRGQLDLATLKAAEGDMVLVRGVARDNFELDGVVHEPQYSPPRRLRVIGEVDFAQQMRRELSALRQQAIRIEAIQGELQDDVIDDGVQPGIARAQAQIAERLAEQQEAVQGIARRLRDNRLNDEALRGLLGQSGDLLNYAGRAANKAAEAIEQRERPGQAADQAGAAAQPEAKAGESAEAAPSSRPSRAAGGAEQAQSQPRGSGERDAQADSRGAARPAEQGGAQQQQPGADAAPAGEDGAGQQPEQPQGAAGDQPELREAAPEDRPIVEAQQEVRDELTDLIELLDRDEDTWVVTRQLDSLLEAQDKLGQETEQLNQQTLGRSRSELTAIELTELDRIAQRQSDLADQARKLMDDMRERARNLNDLDPQAASGLRRAANTGEQQELDQNMDQAAEQAEDNQLRNARAAQQQAGRTMRQMRQDIDNTKRAQAEELQRRLSSLVESIERLIGVQEGELKALATAIETGEFGGRDRGMIRLVQNTNAVAVEARNAGPDARRVARSLDRAGDAQSAAVAAFRGLLLNADIAREAEERSLTMLQEALKLAEELRDQAEADARMQKLEELLAAYRAQLEKQVAVRGETLKLADQGDLERRGLVEARMLGARQQEIGDALDEIARVNQEIADSPVFIHVHQLISEWSRSASGELQEGSVAPVVTDAQQLVADSVSRLVAALDESMQEQRPSDFASDGGGSQGGGGGGEPPLIPPVKQLMLLRGMQEQILDQTRRLDDGAAAVPAARDRLRELGRQQRTLLQLGEQLLESLQQGGPASPDALEEQPGDPVPDAPEKPENSGEAPEPLPIEPQPLPLPQPG